MIRDQGQGQRIADPSEQQPGVAQEGAAPDDFP